MAAFLASNQGVRVRISFGTPYKIMKKIKVGEYYIEKRSGWIFKLLSFKPFKDINIGGNGVVEWVYPKKVVKCYKALRNTPINEKYFMGRYTFFNTHKHISKIKFAILSMRDN